MKQAELIIVGLCGQSVFLTVPHFHQPEETLHAQAFFAEPGGKGYNQAVAAARLGAETVFFAAVGKDADGAACEARLQKEGVQGMLLQKKAHTAYAAILTDPAGENKVTVYPGASALLTGADVRGLSAFFRGARYALLTPEIPEEAFAAAVDLAEEAGLRLIINPAPFASWVTPYLGRAWCVTPNRNEVRSMLGLSPAESPERALAHAPYKRAVVTLGSEGALCLENGKITKIPAASVRSVDTTGAGDALNGALCAALLENLPLDAAARFAVKAASRSVTRPHVLDALPTRAEMDGL